MHTSARTRTRTASTKTVKRKIYYSKSILSYVMVYLLQSNSRHHTNFLLMDMNFLKKEYNKNSHDYQGR